MTGPAGPTGATGVTGATGDGGPAGLSGTTMVMNRIYEVAGIERFLSVSNSIAGDSVEDVATVTPATEMVLSNFSANKAESDQVYTERKIQLWASPGGLLVECEMSGNTDGCAQDFTATVQPNSLLYAKSVVTDWPFIPGEPVQPVPLGDVGITFVMAR